MNRLAAATLAILVIGCGGAAKQATAPSGATPEPAPEGGDAADSPNTLDSRAQQIETLWAEIEDWSGQIGIRTAAQSTSEAPEEPCKDVERKAECNDTCTIADSICSNAEKICTLADELQERSATDKCTEAKSSCERANGACCKCNR